MSADWDNFKVGDKESFEVTFTKEMLDSFISISGDDNLLHTDQSFAEGKVFKGPVIHGMLLASCFSKLVGKFFLKDRNLYLAQSLNFKKPVYVMDKVIVEGIIKSKLDSSRVLEIITKIINNNGEEVLTGLATVKYI